MDGFFWKVGATPSICIFASCVVLRDVEEILLGVGFGELLVLALEEPDNHEDIFFLS